MATGIAERTIRNLEQVESMPQSELIEAITRGLPAELVRQLAARMDITMEQMAELLRLTSRTLQRRLDEGRLELSESDRLWELWQLFSRAVEVMESEDAAALWLQSPIQAIGWTTPLALARTAPGLRELQNILGRIEHGVFS